MEDQHHKLLEITMRNPQLCGIVISGAGCVGRAHNWEDGGRKNEDGGGGRKQERGGSGRE